MTRHSISRLIGSRDAYLRVLLAAHGRMRAKLEQVEHKIDLAMGSGRIAGSDQLRSALRRARHGKIRLQHLLATLQASDSRNWDQVRSEAEDALEEFSDSVRKVIARFP